MSSASPKKILVIEDDEDIVVLLTLLLEQQGHRVLHAGNGREGLAMLERETPDLILLDLKMPVMSGREFAREYHQRKLKAQPLIVVTAAEDPERRAAEVGADASVSKPFDPNTLIALVDRQLGQAAQYASAKRPRL